MRILIVSRIQPDRRQGPTARRLHDRLREITDLGHEVLVLTKWDEHSQDYGLPTRVEVRFPFRFFHAWEWPRALPLVLSWNPDLIHILDTNSAFSNGLSPSALLSAEMSALSLRDLMRSLKIPLRGDCVVSLLPNTRRQPSLARANLETLWLKAGAT
ncbi:MAG: hypothetical protein RBT63_02130, partial [Bdellovibrionales bacterium]|nr:hypothetical protein [Bdellovibrionales bacterium]